MSSSFAPRGPCSRGAATVIPSPALKGTLSPSDGERAGVRGPTSIPQPTPAQAAGSGVLRLLTSAGASRFPTLTAALLASGMLFFGISLLAADKSGVSPNTISLPKGPGSIEGLGESFQPTLNTGTAKYSIALKVPPGTAGQTPDLRLVYEGGGGNGILGFGWQFPIASIQRRTDKG
ncbi:MAG: SpvB/TcaC N-terminal domain-containing protein, partial [Verrucomicrobiota bacterium]